MAVLAIPFSRGRGKAWGCCRGGYCGWNRIAVYHGVAIVGVDGECQPVATISGGVGSGFIVWIGGGKYSILKVPT